MGRSFLILHGYQGSESEHWQSWLADRLRAAGERVAYPALPDPHEPAVLYGEPLGIPVDVLAGGGHVNTEAGYGPWPAAEDWCYGASAITSSRIAPG